MLYVLPVKHTQLYIRQDSSLSVVSGLPAGQLKNSGLFPGIPSDPEDFLHFNVSMVVSISSIIIKSTKFSVNFTHFPSLVFSIDCSFQSS